MQVAILLYKFPFNWALNWVLLDEPQAVTAFVRPTDHSIITRLNLFGVPRDNKRG